MKIQVRYFHIVLAILVIAFSFSSCAEEEEPKPKLDFVELMSGDYTGTFSIGSDFVLRDVKANIRAGNNPNEVIFTEQVPDGDSTTSYRIELIDLESQQGIDLSIPQQTIGGVQFVGTALDGASGEDGFFFYQDTETEEIFNEIVFTVTGNNLVYKYDFIKDEEE